MYKYIFNTKGKYVAFVIDRYCFSPKNDYIGFFKGTKLYNYKGKYLGELTSDDRVVKNKDINYPDIIPIFKPPKYILPLRPLNRLSMSKLPNNYEDIFINEILNDELGELDNKYNGLIDMKIYSNDKTFLGKIDFNKYSQDSLANKYGTYGSQYSQNSIFNKYGPYGSPYSDYSLLNPYSTTPPQIIDSNNQIVGVLTANKFLHNRIDAIEFLKWFNLKIDR